MEATQRCSTNCSFAKPPGRVYRSLLKTSIMEALQHSMLHNTIPPPPQPMSMSQHRAHAPDGIACGHSPYLPGNAGHARASSCLKGRQGLQPKHGLEAGGIQQDPLLQTAFMHALAQGPHRRYFSTPSEGSCKIGFRQWRWLQQQGPRGEILKRRSI